MFITQKQRFQKESKPLNKCNWYVLYTAPRAEQVAVKELQYYGYDAFLPMVKTLRVWKNRQRKMVNNVLFPSYVFVRTEEKYLAEICRINKIVSFVQCGGTASKVDVKSIEGIKKMLGSNGEISVAQDFKEGELIRVIQGPLMGYEGILVQQKSKTKFGIHLKEINHTILIEIRADMIEKVHDRQLG